MNTERKRFTIVPWLGAFALLLGLFVAAEAGPEAGQTFFFWMSMCALYFLPALIAHLREHPNENAITALNLLLGWIGIGWIVALVWAFTNQREDAGTIRAINDLRDQLAKQAPLKQAEIAQNGDLVVRRPGHKPMTIHA